MSQYTETVTSLRKRIENNERVTDAQIESLRGLMNTEGVEPTIESLKQLRDAKLGMTVR